MASIHILEGDVALKLSLYYRTTGIPLPNNVPVRLGFTYHGCCTLCSRRSEVLRKKERTHRGSHYFQVPVTRLETELREPLFQKIDENNTIGILTRTARWRSQIAAEIQLNCNEWST